VDLKSGFPYWLIKDGLPYSYPTLEDSLESDVVVLGGGISGALSAYYLAEAGVDCAVVDARSIGLGSTCASTSLLQYEIDVPLSRLQKMIGYQQAVRSYLLCAEAIYKLKEISAKIGFGKFEFKKSLYYAASKKDISFLKEEYKIRKENNFDVMLLGDKSIRDIFGFNAPAAILSELGAQTDAYSFTHALHQHNLAKGTKVFDRVNVTKIHHNKNEVILSTQNKKTIKAKKLIYAVGYEAVNFINKKIVNLNSTYAIISEHYDDDNFAWPGESLIWNTDDPYLYLRTTKDRRIIIGGRDEKFYSPEKRDKLLDQKSDRLEMDFRKIFPKIPFKKEYKWTGTFGSTKDGLPFIGPYEKLPNSLFALGFGGNGITFSQIAAEINRDLIMGNKKQDAALFSFERI
jgi:glycine/D-amino acid oxidase-like deaminating enzyme